MKNIKRIIAITMICVLLTIGTITILSPTNKYSFQENRTLTQFPSITLNGILDGSFQEQLTDALSDQIPMRNLLTQTGTSIKKVLGKKDINNTYLGKDHYYFEKILDKDIDEKRYQKNLNSINNLVKNNNIHCKVMLVPSSGIVLKDKLPDDAMMYNADKLYDEAANILTDCKVYNITQQLTESKEQVYYRTDHHWTTEGAYIGYNVLMNKKYKTNQTTLVTDEFYGTLYSRTLDSSAIADSIELPDVSRETQVTINGNESTLYHYDKLKEKDKYQVFLGGNYGEVDIQGEGKGTVVIIKDSFANSLVPYLTKDYKNIIMIDLRYYPGSVKQLLQRTHVDDLFVIYELNNFANDSSIAKLAL